jgi:hypothetical protein
MPMLETAIKLIAFPIAVYRTLVQLAQTRKENSAPLAPLTPIKEELAPPRPLSPQSRHVVDETPADAPWDFPEDFPGQNALGGLRKR